MRDIIQAVWTVLGPLVTLLVKGLALPLKLIVAPAILFLVDSFNVH